jgi:hypothetical protein
MNQGAFMRRVTLWLAFGVAAAILAAPAHAGWTAKPVNDGHGHSYFLMSASAGNARAEIFCSPDGVVNFSLIWPDQKHGDAADKGEPALMRIEAGDGSSFEAMSYYWASGKGRLILDFGNPPQVREIVEALGAAVNVSVSVEDSANGVELIEVFDIEGAAEAAAAFKDYCQVVD